MRQTETVTETIEKEKEVEYVYCDDCGADTTGDVRYEAREVCASCDSTKGRIHRRAKDAIQRARESDDEMVGESYIEEVVFFSFLLPVICLGIIYISITNGGNDIEESIYAYISGIIGTLIWVTLLAALIMF